MALGIKHEGAKGELPRLRSAGASKDGFDSGDELPGGKGFGDVVVDAHVVALELVCFLAFRREHDEW